MPGPAAGSKSISGFDPRSIGGCQLWLDGADPTFTGPLANSATVSTWNDKSPSTSANNGTAAGTGTPTYNLTRKGITLSGTNYYTLPAGAISSGSTNYTIFTVFYATSLPSAAYLWFAGTSGTADIGMGLILYAAGNIESGFWTDYMGVTGPGVVAINNTYVVTTIFNGNTRTLYVNGVAIISGSPTGTKNIASATNYIGSGSGSTNFVGTINEVISYNFAMPTRQRQAVEGYLAWKWSIQASISSFSPIYISGCVLWLDAQDLTTMFQTTAGTSPVTAATQSVGLWSDKSGNGYNALVSNPSGSPTATFPTYQTTTGPAVYFANSADMMFFSNFFTGTSGYDIFVVGQPLPSTAPNYRTLLRGSTSEHPIIINSGGTQIGAFLNTGGFNQFGGASGLTWPDNSLQLLYVTISSTNTYQAALNGTSTLSAAVNAGVNNNFAYFGNYQGGAQPWGYVNELIILSNVTPTQRALIETYLSRKWGKTVNTTVTNAHPYTSIRPFTRQFSPLDLPGCALWLDAADYSTFSFSSGSILSAWNDKSGNARNMGVGSGSTTVVSNSVYLNSSYMYVASAVDLTNLTVFIVTQSTTTTGNQTVFVGRPNSTADYSSVDGFGFYVDNGQIRFYGQAAALQYSQFSATTANKNLFSFNSSGTAINAWLNGTSQTGGTLTATRTNTANGFAIGASWNGSLYNNIIATSYIYEIVAYNTSLTISQRQAVEGYLAQKWNTTLTSHPFSKFPPSSPTIFSPTNFIGCQLWMDASQETSANNATISTIPDRSGNGIALTAIGSISNYQNYRNGNSVYYFGNSRASNASFPWGTSFTHIVVASSVGGTWLNSVGTLTSYVSLGNWSLTNINSTTSFEDPGAVNSSANWTLANGATVSVSNLVLSLSLTTTSGSKGQTIYTVPISSSRQTSISFYLPASCGTNIQFGWTNGTTTLAFSINLSGSAPASITCPGTSGTGNVTFTTTNNSTYFVIINIYNTTYTITASSYPLGVYTPVSLSPTWTNSGASAYSFFFTTSATSSLATTLTNVQFDPGQGCSVLPRSAGLANSWHILSAGYTAGSTTMTNYAINGYNRSSSASAAYSGTTPLLPLYIGGSSGGAYDTNTFAEIIHYNVALSTTQRQAIEGYLSAKWSIPLPITHPYYTYSPSQQSQTSLVANVSISFSSTTLTSSWGGSPDAISYLFTIYQSSSLTGALTTYSTSTLTSTSYTSTGLPVNSYYRMTISAIGPGGTTRASVSSSVPCLAAPTSLTNTITGTTLTLNWIGAANASGYSYTLNGGGQVAVGNVVSYTYPTALTPGNSYYYNLYATSSTNSISAISASSATVYCLAQPSAPTLVLTTTAGATTTYSFTLSWSGVTTLATNINYYIGTSTTYNVSNVIQGNSANTGSGSVTLSSSSLSSNTLYYAFVQGYSTNTTSTASSASSGTWCLAAPTLNSPTFSPFATYTTQLNWTNNSTSSQGATNILVYIGALSNSTSSTTLTGYSGAVGGGTSVATQFQYVANTVYTFYVKTIGTNTSATSRILSFAYYNSVAKRSLTISTGYTVTASFSGSGGGGGYGTDGAGSTANGGFPGVGAMTSNVTFSVSTGNTINLYIGQAGSNVYGSASGTTTSSAVCGDGTIGGSGGYAYYVAGAYGANGGGAGGGGAATALICSGVAVIVCGGGGGGGNGGGQGGQGGNGGTTANGGIGFDGYSYNGTLINYGHNGGYGGGEGCSVANRTAGWIDAADAKNSLVPYAPSLNQLGWRGTAVYITSITLGADGTSSTNTGTSTTAIGNGGYSGQFYGQAGGGGGGGYSGGGGGLSCNQGSTHNSGGGGGGSSYSSAGGTFVASSGSGAGWAFIGYG